MVRGWRKGSVVCYVAQKKDYNAPFLPCFLCLTFHSIHQVKDSDKGMQLLWASRPILWDWSISHPICTSCCSIASRGLGESNSKGDERKCNHTSLWNSTAVINIERHRLVLTGREELTRGFNMQQRGWKEPLRLDFSFCKSIPKMVRQK